MVSEKEILSKSLQVLSKNLARLQSIEKHGDEEVWTLTNSFADLEESFLLILRDYFPKLIDETLTQEELENVLFDIGDEFRHVVYHIGNSNFYSYLSISSPELSEE